MIEITQSTMAEKDILEVIKAYADSDVDYAIMLNGPWGSGKTYFVENKLKAELSLSKDGENGKTKYLYLSLYGIKSIEQFRNELFSCIIKRFNKSLSRASSILSLLSDITSGSSEKISCIMNGAKSFMNHRVQKGLEKDISSHLFLVIDDLERYEGNDYRELLGFITSKCLNNHVHVLFICNEDNLLAFNNEEERGNYFLIKEKSIRHTIRYYAELHCILLSVLEKNKSKYPCLGKYKEEHAPELSKLFLTLRNERNIRTWYVAFDCFEEYAAKYGEKMLTQPKYLERVLRDILISASLYSKYPIYFEKTNKNQYFPEEMQKKGQQEQTKKEYLFNMFNTYPRSPLTDSYNRIYFIENPLTGFLSCSYLFDYFETGYLDYQKTKDHFDRIYPIPTEYEMAYIDLKNYSIISEEKLMNAFEVFRRGLENKQYGIEEILNIIIIEPILKQNHYLELFRQNDLLEVIYNYLKNLDITHYDYKRLNDLKEDIIRINSSPLYELLKELINGKLAELENTDRLQSVDKIISDANSSIHFMPFEIMNFIENMVELGCYDRLKSLNNNGLISLSEDFKGIVCNNPDTKLQDFSKPFCDGIQKLYIDEPCSKWDIDFNSFLRSVRACVNSKAIRNLE